MEESETVQPVRTETLPLFSMDIATRMARVLGAHSEEDAKRLHEILNDFSSFVGTFAYTIAFHLQKPGPRPVQQRANLKKSANAGKKFLDLVEALHWQTRELISAGYAREKAVFTASSDKTVSQAYNQNANDIESTKRLLENIQYAVEQIDTSSKDKLGNLERLARHIVEAFEAFMSEPIWGERSNKTNVPAGKFMKSGLNYITSNQYPDSQINTAIRRAAEWSRKRRETPEPG
jgi:t-SNARE complex subunit (syntaxin)